jgi:HD-like signal output (HDOD) protein
MNPTLCLSDTWKDLDALRSFLTARLQDTLELPVLPLVAHQVLLLSGDGTANASKLSSLIQQDQALACTILRLANSPAFASRTPLVSLQQAIAWLGFNLLNGLAFSLAIQRGTFHTAGYETQVREIWRHALATGLFGKEISRRIRQNVENAFLCGLLHAIGKPVLLHLLPPSPGSSSATLPWESLHTVLEELHITAGIKLATAWQLPQPVQETIRYYRDDQYHQASSPTKAAMITCLASHLASFTLHGTPQDEPGLRALPVVQELNFYPEDMSDLLSLCDTIKPSVEGFLT